MTTTPQTVRSPVEAGGEAGVESGPRAHAEADTEAPGNLAVQLADLAERRGWGARAAFHQGHRTWTHGEVHALAARAATVLAGQGGTAR